MSVLKTAFSLAQASAWTSCPASNILNSYGDETAQTDMWEMGGGGRVREILQSVGL